MMNKKYGIRTYVVWFTLMPLMLWESNKVPY
jgi:hypothetical protein